MHHLSCFKFMFEYTSFNFLIFIIWKLDIKSKKKSRAVIDIQKLIEIVLPNFCSLTLSLEMIANVQRCTNFTILNTAFFFYQWLFYLDHCFIFIVVTHYNQKTFQVLIIGYINLVAYIQCDKDNILQNMHAWARTYVDNIIYRVKYLSDLLKKLCILFNIFLKYNISIKPTKSFFNYLDIRLLS